MNAEAYEHPMLFSNEQAAVINDEHHLRLIIAGAGSGKTYTLTGQIWKWILEGGVEPSKIVAITFTNVGADELKRRMPASFGRLGFIGTLHSWCLMLLNRYGSAIGYRPGKVTIIDEETEDALIKAAIAGTRGAGRVPVSEVKAAKGNAKLFKPAAIIAKAYCQKLKAANAVDFDTVLIEALALLKGGHVPAFEALLVDEYQDSGALDALIYEASPARRKFIVGDPDQAIFPFRGGRIENILELAENPDWHVHFLNDNYRSVPQIVDAANQLIERNEARLKKTMTAARHDNAGEIRDLIHKSPMSEAAFIARMIAEAVAAGPMEPKHFAVLARYNAQLPAIAQAIQSEGLPVIFKEEKPHPWLAAAVAALNALFDPDNEVLAAAWLASIKFTGTAREAFRGYQIPAETPGKAIHSMQLAIEAVQAITAAWSDTIPATIARLVESQADSLPKGEGVFVSTIHGAKGAEFDNVFLAGCHNEAIPGRKTGEEKECERRLFYVGITRARQSCWLSYSTKAIKAFSPALVDTFASPFIAESLA